MASGGKGGASQTTGYLYKMDVHMGLFRGPINVLRQIRVGDRTAWKGEVSTNQTFNIHSPDLFGGQTSEGGIDGKIYAMFGAPDQIADSYVKDKIGEGDPSGVPEFRGVTTLYYTGEVSANNPYPKAWKMRCGRSTAGWDNQDTWYPEKCLIELLPDTDNTGDDPTLIHGMNPIHSLYECMTNRSWGKGWPRSFLDDAAWRKAADTIYSEGFGMCLKWNRQDNISEVVKQFNDTIGAGIYVDRGSGLLTINLIRADYDETAIPFFDYNSGLISIDDDNGSAPTTAINEIVVRYTNPEKDEVAEARVHNLAGVQVSGKATSTVEYLGLPTFSLATRVGQRDLRSFAFGLKRYTLVFDRAAWRLAPTMVFRIQDLQRGLGNIILRVAEVEDHLDDNGDGTITIKAVQDVFGLPATSFVAQQPPTWQPPSGTPVPAVFMDMQEASYRDLALVLTAAELGAVQPDQGAILTVATRPTSMSIYYNLWTRTGVEAYAQRAVGDWTPSGSLGAAMAVYDTTFTLSGMTDIDDGSVVEGQGVYIGNEIMKVVSRVDTLVTVERGCADTLPQTHNVADRVWFYDRYAATDRRDYASGEQVFAKVQTHTSSADQDLATAVEMSEIMARRQYRPYPPGNLKLNGTPVFNVANLKGDIVFTWTYRDRVSQADVLFGHTTGNIGPEAGTTYTLRFYNGVTLLRTVPGITAATYTYTYDLAEADGWVPNLTFELESVRATYASSQKYRWTFGHVPLGPFRPVITTPSANVDVGNTNPFVAGTSEPGKSIQLYVGTFPSGVANGSAVTADGSGNWSKTLTGLALGAHNVYAIATDGFGSSPPSVSRILTVQWYNPLATISTDYKNSRYRLNGAITTVVANDWSGLFDTIVSPAQCFLCRDGKMRYWAANTMTVVAGDGRYKQKSSTNRNTNFNCAPLTGVTTNLTKSGDPLSTLTADNDAAQLALNVFSDASMASVFTTGNCFHVIPNAATTDTLILIGGTTAVTTACSFMIASRSSGGSFTIETNAAIPQVLATVTASTGYKITKIENWTPGATTDQIRLRIPAGVDVRFIADQLENGPVCTGLIPSAGAATARGDAGVFRTLGATEFSSIEGFVFQRAIRTSAVDSVSSIMWEIQEPDAANRLILQAIGSTTVRGSTLVASTQVNTPVQAAVAGTIHQAVFGWKANNLLISVDALAAGVTATAGVPSGTPAKWTGPATTVFCGVVEREDIGKVEPSAAEVARMSGWVLA